VTLMSSELICSTPSKEGPAIRFPQASEGLAQDREWCEVKLNDRWQKFRFHDYERIYEVPGLYEALFYKHLKCSSPQRVAGLLDDLLSDHRVDPEELRVLDVGAGNGMVGEQLKLLGAKHIVGVDIVEEAKMAAERDRPDVYDEYLVTDLCGPSPEDQQALEEFDFNCMTTVAALGFGDIPVHAFTKAFSFIEEGGWLAFNIKEDFLDEEDDTGFSAMIRHMQHSGTIRMQAYRRYRHRFTVCGDPLNYVAIIATKQTQLPDALVD